MTERKDAAAMLRPEVAAKVAEHYEHARRKHPYFADGLFLWDDSAKDAGRILAGVRGTLAIEKYKHSVLAKTVLNCEIAEVAVAYASGDKPHAVKECYDAIAVLLRMVDVIEGRQALGNCNGESAKEAK